jgi:Xaa-Pro aminopeptidase
MNDRIRELAAQLREWGCASLLIEHPIDLFYLTGLTLSRGRLVVTPEETRLFVDGRYISYARERASVAVFLWKKDTNISLLSPAGFDSSWTTVASLEQLRKEMPHTQFIPKFRPLQKQRLIKTESEIALMRKAAAITWNGVQHIKTLFKEGVCERDLAIEFEYFVRKQGASGLSFAPIIAFGEQSAYPHHRSSEQRLENNQIILVDVGAVYEGYCGDMTRVFFFGQPDVQLQKMYELVQKAAQAAAASVRLGVPLGLLDRTARNVLAKEGKEELFTHNLGHGIGLECHEYPSLRFDGEDRDVSLAENMVFTIEPGLYQPGLGGVRYENTGVVTKDGFESFYA